MMGESIFNEDGSLKCDICGKPLWGGPLDHLTEKEREECERLRKMTERTRLNFTVAELDAIHRLAEAQRELGEIADSLFYKKYGKKKDERETIGRKLNGIKASIKTVEMFIGKEPNGNSDAASPTVSE